MMTFYALERRSRWWTLAFAVACWSAALYGWLAGAWPFTLVEAVWGLVALRKFLRKRENQHARR
jgi:hypothetical protein